MLEVLPDTMYCVPVDCAVSIPDLIEVNAFDNETFWLLYWTVISSGEPVDAILCSIMSDPALFEIIPASSDIPDLIVTILLNGVLS